MSADLLAQLRSNGPVSPAVQMRKLLEFGRQRDWPFETAWRWSYERVKWPHDTGHRKEWKAILGESATDSRPMVERQRQAWRSAYVREPADRRHASVGRLLTAA